MIVIIPAWVNEKVCVTADDMLTIDTRSAWWTMVKSFPDSVLRLPVTFIDLNGRVLVINRVHHKTRNQENNTNVQLGFFTSQKYKKTPLNIKVCQPFSASEAAAAACLTKSYVDVDRHSSIALSWGTYLIL